MNAHLHDTRGSNDTTPQQDQRNYLVGGIILVFAGLLLLLGQFFDIGVWFLIILGLGFIAAGVLTRAAGWFIPGGIVGGIGLGALVIDRGLVASENAEGGLFLLVFALGWASIYLLTRLFTDHPQTWALIPGGILALIGGALLLGGTGLVAIELVFQALAYIWPLALIAAGVVVLFKAMQR